MSDGFVDPAEYWGITPEMVRTLPLGLRHSNNLLNIKYFKGAERNQQRWPGLVGPSVARDEGSPQMLFRSVDDSAVAGAGLLRRKYDSGLRTTDQIIAHPTRGWTPGRHDSAKAVAGYADVDPRADLRLDTPEGMRRFLPALATQEHGTWARDKLYTDDMFDRIAERATGAQFASGDLPALSILKEDGSNAHRWGSAPRANGFVPPEPVKPSPAPSVSQAPSAWDAPYSAAGSPRVPPANQTEKSKPAEDVPQLKTSAPGTVDFSRHFANAPQWRPVYGR